MFEYIGISDDVGIYQDTSTKNAEFPHKNTVEVVGKTGMS